MTCWAVIPIKAPGAGKTRLARALGPERRAALVRAMLARVVDAAERAAGIDDVRLLGPSRHGLSERLRLLDEPGGGLNAALASALAELSAQGLSRAVFVAADLPRVTAADVEALACLPLDTVGIATDRHGTGTNAISLPLPAAQAFAFAFGPGSRARHHAAAAALGLVAQDVRRPGLADDVDVPADLAADFPEELAGR